MVLASGGLSEHQHKIGGFTAAPTYRVRRCELTEAESDGPLNEEGYYQTKYDALWTAINEVLAETAL